MRQADGSIEMAGDVALPEAEGLLHLRDTGDFDTIGGLITAELGRFPREGDQLEIGPYAVTVVSVTKKRIETLRFARKE
jgi:putative hemolysin